MAANQPEGTTFRSIGLDVQFPFDLYPIQKTMIGRLITAYTNRHHCLLESPTGTGKTLVLLCSALAWQLKSKNDGQPYRSAKLLDEIKTKRKAALEKKSCTCGRRQVPNELNELKEAKENMKSNKSLESKAKVFEETFDQTFSEDEDYANGSANKRLRTNSELTTSPYFPAKKKKQPSDDSDSDCIIIEDEQEKLTKEMKKNRKLKNDCVKPICFNDDKKVVNSLELDNDIHTSDDIKVVEEVSTKTKNGESTVDNQPCANCKALAAHETYDETVGQTYLTAEHKRVPRIFYGTRTHKQISQVVRELNKTPYKKGLRMCILSSRERTCINENVKNEPTKNDLCQELRKNNKSHANTRKKKDPGEMCPYYQDSSTLASAFEQINLEYEEKAWDIEDANKFGEHYRLCPYYGLRSLQQQADITFSPYNYLIDPQIRKNLEINLKNSIVILDEAHNIEDICRDSASFVIDSVQLETLIQSLSTASSYYLQGTAIADAYQLFKRKFTDLLLYLKEFKFEGCIEQSGSDNKIEKIFSQFELRQHLDTVGLDPSGHKKIVESLKIIGGGEEETDEKSRNHESNDQDLQFAQLQFIKQLANTLNFMYNDKENFFNDFKCVIDRSNGFNTYRKNRPQSASSRQSATQNSSEKDPRVWKFSLLCMNPGVSFESLKSSAWSVVVASGTLSPIESLKTELGCKFGVVFEGAHVIGADRVFASILSRGPTGLDLNCSWGNSTKIPFQFEVGSIVRDICSTVPNGVVVFFPSYDRMENFYQQWFMKGYIDEIKRSGKRLFRESSNQTPAKFETELNNYNRHAKLKGAVLFAVFRGKVSEGIDFADQAARAVITIGIPYPNIKEVTIGLKKSYNDAERAKKPHLMTGADWYSSQAFRALNQALGRCIRHKNDWGAVIMIDSRLENSWSCSSISKWIRKLMLKSNSYSDTYESLKEFVRSRMDAEESTMESIG